MPELPEVETTRLGLLQFKGQAIQKVFIHNPNLRWQVDLTLKEKLQHQVLRDIKRRAKYLLFEFDCGTLIAHLGMSGHFKIESPEQAWLKHDHFSLEFKGHSLRLNDPRRFGAILYTEDDWHDYARFSHLGPEPLEPSFNAKVLHQALAKRSIPIKTAIMDNKVVVGVGNIYACESLFRARISPFTKACDLSIEQCKSLASTVKQVLKQAIKSGGTTLRDFQHSDGKLGYFGQKLQVYGKQDEPCPSCFEPIQRVVQSGRSTFYCAECQIS